MKSLAGWALLVFALAGANAQTLPAPPAKPAGVDELPSYKSEVNNVNLLFTVTDKRGRFITNLVREDFAVREGKNLQKVLQFSAESDLPLRLAILVDSSNSIRDRFRFIQQAATQFISTVMRAKVDKATVVSFDTAAEVQADLTNDVAKLEGVIRDLRPGGGTSLYDAVFFASRDKLALEQPPYRYRRAMVILSDGEDNQSRYSRDQALEMAQRSDVVIFTISTNITREDTDGDKVLKYLAAETGGASFFPFKVEDLAQSFENIANEMRCQYSLLYLPEPLKTDGSFQTVEVIVKTKPGLVVRARRGYYAPKK
jgi:VWFA-related protein